MYVEQYESKSIQKKSFYRRIYVCQRLTRYNRRIDLLFFFSLFFSAYIHRVQR